MHDHRKLGRELELFDSDPLIGAGLPYWLPAGAAIRHALEEFIREAERRDGYQHVYSPILGKRELYEMSGHWAHYREDMFPPLDLGSEQLLLRPSLCPHHAVIYRSRQHSYRELPLRLAELGGQFRQEASGVLGGLTRVRAMQLNDAHIFCQPEQVGAEVGAVLDLIEHAYTAVGITAHRYRLSLRGSTDKYVDDAAMWDLGEQALAEVLDKRGLAYDAAAGEGAFYGPKIDVQIMDQAGRESTLSTVQLDFHQPRQFDLSYVAPDQSLQRPVMIHRSILGSLERLVAHLTEVHAGAFPTWMAPVQVAVLPVSEEQCRRPWSWPAGLPRPGSGLRSRNRTAAPWEPASGFIALCPTKLSSAHVRPRVTPSRYVCATASVSTPCQPGKRSTASSPSQPAAAWSSERDCETEAFTPVVAPYGPRSEVVRRSLRRRAQPVPGSRQLRCGGAVVVMVFSDR
jgi:threonyl-tRNA synthetase